MSEHNQTLGVQTLGSVSILKARSSMLGDSLNQCRKGFEGCLASRRALIVLDLSDSPLINSEGLEFIVVTVHGVNSDSALV